MSKQELEELLRLLDKFQVWEDVKCSHSIALASTVRLAAKFEEHWASLKSNLRFTRDWINSEHMHFADTPPA